MAADKAGLTRRRAAEGGTEGSEGKDWCEGEAAVANGPASGDAVTGSAGPALLEPAPAAVWSSGVPFYPPSTKFWRIGGKWYDFNSFLPKHPGGATVLEMARDRFEDCTFVFESHHHNYPKVRAIIKKYEVPEEVVLAHGLRQRPKREEADSRPGHHDAILDSGASVQLLDDDAFYSVMRRRVTEHLRAVGHPDGGPTMECKVLFWANFCLWLVTWWASWRFGTLLAAVVAGITASWLGGFGHNWVHQPKYKFWAYLSLDAVGFSSDGWFREHLLQHHMYTNTPWDNHFVGTEPFLVTDPTKERNFIQRCILPFFNPVILCFGLYGNYVAHTVELLRGNERFSPGKLLLPAQVTALIWRWGLIHGVLLHFTSSAVLGMYYFTMALMNHNAEHCMNIAERNESRDWAIAQLNSSADWSVQCGFKSAVRYLWLNYHTVHHLFPLTDFSHHPAIQAILLETCKEFGVSYRVSHPLTIYKEMVQSFASPRSLMQEVLVYAGGL